MTTKKQYRDLLTRGPVSGGPAPEGAGSAVSTAAGRDELLDRLRAEIAYVERKTGTTVDSAAVETLLDQARDGLARLSWDGEEPLPPGARSGLEAVVRTDGSRPALFVEDDFVDITVPSAQAYATGLARMVHDIRQVCRSVGRVDDPSAMATLGYRGTAWTVGDGLVATNYHVLEAISPGGVRRDGRFKGRLTTGVSVHFGHEVGRPRPERRFPIRRVVSVGREGGAEHVHPDLPDVLNFDGLDLAVLQLEPVPGRPFPEPNVIPGRGGLASRGRGVYLVGYPGDELSTTPDLFETIFANVRSFKTLCPGQIMDAAGEVPYDPRGWIFTHDASTLRGNSGSALVDYDGDGRTVLGLHVAGYHARQNWAHATERITAELLPAPSSPDPP